MLRMCEPALKLILFYWKNDEACKYGYKTSCLLENLILGVGDVVWSCQFIFRY